MAIIYKREIQRLFPILEAIKEGETIDSSNDLKHPCYRNLFSSSLLTLMDDDDFNKHFLSFLKNEKKINEEMFNSL